MKQTLFQKAKKHYELILVLLVLAVYVLFHFSSLHNAPWELYDAWRQGDTYSIAQNYYLFSMNPLRPMFNYDGAERVVIQLELQIAPYISAVIFKILGYMTPFVPRLLGLLFFCGSAWFVYKIARRFTSFIPAVFALAVYLIFPINLLYSRAIMPESTALFFLTGTVWFLLLWYEDSNQPAIWLSAVFCAVAIMEKTPTMFVGVLIVFVFFWKLGLKSFKSIQFYGYGLISLGIPAAYYLYAASVASMTFVSSIASKHILTEKIFSIFTPGSINFFRNALPTYYSTAALIVALFGFILTLNRKGKFLAVLTVSFLLELATIVAIIRYGYYLIFIAPVCALLCAVLVHKITRWHWIPAVVVCCSVLVLTWHTAAPLYRSSVVVNETIDRIGTFVNTNTEQDASLAFSVGDPVYINASNRPGFRANLQYHDFIPVGAQAETAFYVENGVDYFVVLNSGMINDPDGVYLQYLKEHFPVHASNDLCTIYDLQGS